MYRTYFEFVRKRRYEIIP